MLRPKERTTIEPAWLATLPATLLTKRSVAVA
jgi:hypothetical protein